MNIFISDLHLSEDRPDTVDLFVHFMRTRPATGDHLYILGDLFDAWIGDDDDAPLANRIRAEFNALTGRGVALYVQRGNRDFLLGKRFMRETGAELLPDCYLMQVAGERTLLMHGDLLCTDDIAYQKARKKLRNPVFQWLMQLKSLSSRRKIATDYRARSQNKIANTAAEIMDANAQTVVHYMQKHDVRQLIHGHTHRPDVHQHRLADGRLGIRHVLDEWHPDYACVRVDDGVDLKEEKFFRPKS